MTDRADEIALEALGGAEIVYECNAAGVMPKWANLGEVAAIVRAYGDERYEAGAASLRGMCIHPEAQKAFGEGRQAGLEEAAKLCENECKDDDGCWPCWFAGEIRDLKEKP